MVTLAAYQPRPFPCLHWWNRMDQADVFIVLDGLQFKKGSWQQRYEVWMNGNKLLRTIPVNHGDLFKPINQVRVSPGRWLDKHLKTLKQSYQKEPFFLVGYKTAELSLERDMLVDVSLTGIYTLKELLGIDTHMVLLSNVKAMVKRLEPIKKEALAEGGNQLLVDLCRLYNADTYISGGTAYTNYLDTELFQEVGIEVEVQEWPCAYERGDISILDPLMRYGSEARKWIK
jgi:hypothetical protein